MIPEGRDSQLTKLSNGTMNLNNNNTSTTNLNSNANSIKPSQIISKPNANKENEKPLIVSYEEKKKISLIETEVASEIVSSEMQESKKKVRKPPMVYKLVLTGGPCSGG